MNFMCILFLTLIGQSASITLPKQIQFAHYVVQHEANFYILDGYQDMLARVDTDGNMVNQYHAKGLGPGEYQSLTNLVVVENSIFLIDNKQRKVIELDHDFQFKKQWFYQGGGVGGGIAITPRSAYLYYYSPEKQNTVIHQYDREWNLIRDFGHCFQPDEPKVKDPTRFGLSFTQGSLAVANGKLFALHHFGYRIDVFDLDGNLLEKIPIPRVSPSSLFNQKRQTLEVIARALTRDHDGNLYFFLSNRYPNAEVFIPRNLAFKLDTKTHELVSRDLDQIWRYPIADGKVVDVIETDDGCRLEIKDNPFNGVDSP